ncbi:acetylornithine aminotransferase [Gordoniibacillus kamchatkensis]|uniref:Acetylornithine aminotransferase n=1 Tax=Gordoniibacillus kamchatkensis TaxID=1590651 RepID=A0ABR5ALB9_9BACL|nr:acetylornithine transaminase [Paenibacillus sp. VKM B-2647]KIL41818.1 acetylornithine aminotransferase [Paenibacillus sp. VKM B-2647]
MGNGESLAEKSALFPTYAKHPITLVRGEGSRLWDDQGKLYLDFMSGLAVCNLGHVPAKVKRRIQEQLDQLWHVSNLFRIPNQEKLAKLLVANSCADLVFFCNSGAEANEAAIKCARRYHQRVLGNSRYEIITFEKSFHGRTLATLTATGQDKVKDGYYPLPQGFAYAAYNDIRSVKDNITDRTAAVMLELVQGEGGVNLADPEFVTRLSALCQEHGLLLIVDEVQTGLGRTGKLFAYEHFGIEPDIVTLAKGLASGFPIGAMLGKNKLRDAFSTGSHASTFGGAPLAAAAGVATLETLTEERLPERAEQAGAYAMQKLSERLLPYSIVQSVRGIGLLIGIACSEPVAPIVTELHRRGLLVLPGGTHVIRFMPNLYVTNEEIDEAVDLLSSVLASSNRA